jgi:thioredoxin 1
MMRRAAIVLGSGALLWLGACGGATEATGGEAAKPVAGDATKPAGKREDVNIDELIKRQAEGAQIVDVRTDQEWSGGHVPGAVHVPINELRPDHPALAGIDKSKPVYFVCAVGGRSSRAADQMSREGWHAVNVQGGTEAWVSKGQPVEKP